MGILRLLTRLRGHAASPIGEAAEAVVAAPRPPRPAAPTQNPPASVTHAICEHAAPALWLEHRFGLPEDRWNRMGQRCVWVTGAGTGFGRSVAVALAATGARVILSGRRLWRLEESLDEMRSLGISTNRCRMLTCDITDPAQLAETVSVIGREQGRLDGLINNAGTFLTGLGPNPLLDGTVEQWDTQFNLNVRAQWLVTKTAAPLMAQGGEMKVVFISSEAGWAFTPTAGHYNVSKAALNNLGASFAAECQARYPEVDVQINVVAPGEARSEMNQGSDTSPYTLASMVLALLSHPPGGPNGRFFFKDGRHLSFAYAQPWESALM